MVGGKLRRFRFPNTHEDWARLASDLTPDTRVVPEEIILGSCLKLIGELDREVAALEGEI
ncbi:MAG: hypothetical protein QME87_13930 [Bacillota bacterium]|nr:hypothetical protein [Bacillota bacterium]